MATATARSAEVRERLDHPVIDADLHWVEPLPLLLDVLREVGGPAAVDGYLAHIDEVELAWYRLSPEERLATGTMRPPFWTQRANARDLATAMLPDLMAERLGEFGTDLAVVYPTVGLAGLAIEDPDLRRGVGRASNRLAREMFAGQRDRLVPVAAIPVHTPEEAIEELRYAVEGLGFNAIAINGYAVRPFKAGGWFLDFLAIDSPFDYDPFWAVCQELGVAVAVHGPAYWLDRRSPTNFVYSRIGHLAEASHTVCRALIFGGVTRRFPGLRFAFPEGRGAWAANLYVDTLGHWGTRNMEALQANLRPSNVDTKRLAELWQRYAEPVMRDRLGEVLVSPNPWDPFKTLDDLTRQDDGYDDFANVSGVEEITRVFVERFYFGSEVDGPSTSWAFDGKVGIRLNAMFCSDIGHVALPTMGEALGASYGLVERGLLTEEDYRKFAFGNAVELYRSMNRDFFAGTALEEAVAGARR